MSAAVLRHRDTRVMAEPVLDPNVEAAWGEYLGVIRRVPWSAPEYEDLEAHAWLRLQRRLKEAKRRRPKTAAKAAR